MTRTIEAEMWLDVDHVVGCDFNEETGEVTDIEEPRWIIDMETPDGEITRVARKASTLVEFADRWGKDRGIPVHIKFLMTVGG